MEKLNSLKRFSLSLLLIFTFIFTMSILKANACGISDEIVIEGQASWQVQAFEGLSETYKTTNAHEVTICGNDLRIEDACELRYIDMGFMGVGGSTTAEALLCRTGTRVGGEGLFASNMYLDVVIPLPLCSCAYVSGSSVSYINVWAR